jgi:hypothetical protein
MTADLLRDAAALMRKRARAAQHAGVGTTSWYVAWPEPPDKEWKVGYQTNNPLSGLVATTPDYGEMYLPEHIASWHPAVALAVADWLDSAADEDEFFPLDHRAEAVARAYLGHPGGAS